MEQNLGFLKDMVDSVNCRLEILTECIHFISFYEELAHWVCCDIYIGGKFIFGKKKDLFSLLQK